MPPLPTGTGQVEPGQAPPISEPPRPRPPFGLSARLRSFGYAGRGLRFLLVTQHNSWLHGGATLVVLSIAILCPLSRLEWVAVLLAIGLVWIAETFNTALERLGDAITGEHHPLIGEAKDLAAAAVLMTALLAVAIGAIVLAPHLLALLGETRAA